MKQSKFIEGVLVRLDKQLAYSIVSEKTKTFFRLILPLFNADYLHATPGLLLAADGSQLTIRDIATIADCSQEEAVIRLNELARHGFILRDLKTGAIECPIAGEVIKRHILAVEAGKLGGNPALKRKSGNEPPPKVSPKPKAKPKAKAKSKSKGWPTRKASLKVFNPTVAFTLPKESTLEPLPYLKDQVTLKSIHLGPESENKNNGNVGFGPFVVTIEGMINGQKAVLKGEIAVETERQTGDASGEDKEKGQNSTNPTYQVTHFPGSFLFTTKQTANLSSCLQTTENNNLTNQTLDLVSGNLTTGCDIPLTTSLDNSLGDNQGGQVDAPETESAEASHAHRRHARGSHGSLREPVLSTNNTLRVLKPYLTKYNCETNVSRSLCEPGGAGGIFEKTSNSPDEPGVARPTTNPTHETETVANLDSLTANRPKQLFSPGSGFDGGTVPIANRTERTPATDLSLPVTDGLPTQAPLTTEPVATETRPTTFAPVPRFEHSLPADPALEGNDTGTKKPFVLKVLPIPNPFSSHPNVAKGDPELAASLLNGGFPPTKTPSLTTHDRKHEEPPPPSCAPPPPPCPVLSDDEPVSEWHAPSPSDFVECPDVEDFDPAELYDETTPIEDFDPSDPAEISEPDDEDFAPMFDPPEISSLKTVSTAPEAISDAKTTPNESLPTLMLQDASTGFKRPANAILNSTSEKVCAEFEANSILDQNSGQKPDRPIEKKNPGVEVVPVAVVAAEKPSNPDLVQVSLLAVDEAGPAEVPSSSKKVEKAEKPKRAKKAKKAENPDDPAQAEYLANYRRLLTFYGDKIKAKIPNYAAQGAAVKWLLQQGGYTPDECEQCLVDQFENWTKGSPSWLTVKAHIAAWKLRKENPVQPKPAPRQSRPFYDNRDDRRRDRAPSPTQQIHNIVRVVDSAADQVDLSDPDSIVPAPPVVEEAIIPCSVPNIDACLNMLRRFHAMAIHVKKTGGIPVTTNMNHVGANWVYAQCKFPLDLETLSFEEIEKRYRHHHARLATALTKQAQIGNGTPAQNPQSAQSAQSAHPVQKPQNATPKGVVNG